MDTSVLQKIGLSKAEIAVYLALLELGSTASGRVVQQTELRKSTVYESIRRLQEKGLVASIVKEGMKYFEATEPGRIIEFIHEKKRKLNETESEAKVLIRQLAKGFDMLKPHAEAHVLVGIEGFKTMRCDALRHAQGEILLIGAISRENEVLAGFFKEWNTERQKKQIAFRILHKASARPRSMVKTKFMGKFFQTRFLPEEFENPVVINIYGDRVVNVLWKGKYPLCFLLINKEIANAYRQYFTHLWKEASM